MSRASSFMAAVVAADRISKMWQIESTNMALGRTTVMVRGGCRASACAACVADLPVHLQDAQGSWWSRQRQYTLLNWLVFPSQDLLVLLGFWLVFSRPCFRTTPEESHRSPRVLSRRWFCGGLARVVAAVPWAVTLLVTAMLLGDNILVSLSRATRPVACLLHRR
jgi:hypothetical protein